MIPISLRPLEEFKIVLHLALDELLDGNRAIDMVLPEGVAQNFEVLQVRIFGVDGEFDPGHGHVEEDAVIYLTERCAVLKIGSEKARRCWLCRCHAPCSALFDFGDVQLQQAVHPGQ